jgi:glycosyltransferase XagB
MSQKIHRPKASAADINYAIYIPGFIFGFILFSLIFPQLFIFFNHVIYASQNTLKLLLFAKSFTQKYKGTKTKISRRNLPIYSILIPLYKEEKALPYILNSMESLDYPKHLLDIKLIIEEDDDLTIKALETISIPKNFEVIEVPFSLPRTKPKALNYAMEFIRGKLVVIYDAEDRPDPDQLLKCANAFKRLPKKIMCLQAKLEFYNNNQNPLTKFFNIEYRIWFRYLLPSIDKLDIPLPLGGNSNHFRVNTLKEVGMWDPYNVTEDADLGIRLYMEGYRAKMIDSYTYEECPSTFKSWIFQRSRWIKGFIQTFLVFIKQFSKARKNMSQKAIISTIIFIGLSSYSFMILPFYVLTMNSGIFLNKIIADFNLYGTFFYMYLSAFISSSNTRYIELLLWPLYFILHIIASYIALYELLTDPFKWNKTNHFE